MASHLLINWSINLIAFLASYLITNGGSLESFCLLILYENELEQSEHVAQHVKGHFVIAVREVQLSYHAAET